MKPKRIQRKRMKGWKMPEGVVYVGRPTKWGNAFKVVELGTRAEATDFYRKWAATDDPRSEDWRRMVRDELRGKDLACWCPLGQPCHADVLLEIANGAGDAQGEGRK